MEILKGEAHPQILAVVAIHDVHKLGDDDDSPGDVE
jgi:hypothetical protein